MLTVTVALYNKGVRLEEERGFHRYWSILLDLTGLVIILKQVSPVRLACNWLVYNRGRESIDITHTCMNRIM